MEKLIFNKIMIAMESLYHSQSAASRASGYNQSGISLIEGGHNVYIPNSYLSFLASNGINITALFDNNISEDEFRKICTGEAPKLLTSGSTRHPQPCQECKTKDDYIKLLSQTNANQQVTIDILLASNSNSPRNMR